MPNIWGQPPPKDDYITHTFTLVWVKYLCQILCANVCVCGGGQGTLMKFKVSFALTNFFPLMIKPFTKLFLIFCPKKFPRVPQARANLILGMRHCPLPAAATAPALNIVLKSVEAASVLSVDRQALAAAHLLLPGSQMHWISLLLVRSHCNATAYRSYHLRVGQVCNR